MKIFRFYALIITAIIMVVVACNPKSNNLARFSSAQNLIKHVFPVTNVKIDTIAAKSNLSDFMYRGDSVCLKSFYMPLYPEYVKAENGTLVPAIDTPALQYGNKKWTLPLEWKTERLVVDFLLHIKTKTKNYLVIILSSTEGQGTFAQRYKMGWVDVDNGRTFCCAEGFLVSENHFLDYDNDGELEFLETKAARILITDKELQQYFTINICHPTQNPGKPTYVLNKNGDTLSVTYYEADGKLFLTRGLNN